MENMDEKSANPGDIMKHALSLEVLSRIGKLQHVTYSETHAGAGEYFASKQNPKEPYINSLREHVLKETPQDDAGSTYLRLLREWWCQPNQQDPNISYPGGAKQAGEFLKSSKATFELRLTENDEATFRRLEKSIHDYPGTPKLRSFQDEIEWLTGPDSLYLVVDPFGFVESLEMIDKGIDDGYIDHKILRHILDLCENKTSAVVHLWWSKGGRSGPSHMKNRQLLRDWSSKDLGGRAYRQFYNWNNQFSALLGIGDGVSIVRGIPSKEKWIASWLKTYFYESNVAPSVGKGK